MNSYIRSNAREECDEKGDIYQFHEGFDHIDVGHCFTGAHTAVVKSESDPGEEYVQKRQRYW